MPARTIAALLVVAGLTATGHIGERFQLGRVEVIGPLPHGTPRLVTAFRSGDSSDLEAVLAEVRRLRMAMVDSGYLSASLHIDTARSEGVMDLILKPDWGLRPLVRDWQVSCDDSTSVVLVRGSLPRGRPYTRPLAGRAVAQAAAALQRAGFPLAEVAVVSLAESSGGVVPTLRIRSGPRPNVTFIAFQPELAPAGVLGQLARFRPGPYSSTRVAAWRRNIESYGFALVDSVEIVASAVDTGLLVRLRRARASEAFAAVGYSAADRVLSGHARVRLGNLLESGRNLSGMWQSGYGDVQYAVDYLEPCLLRSPVDVTVAMSHRNTDTSYAHTRGLVRAELVAATPVRVVLETGVERVVDAARGRRLDVTWAGTGVVYDVRNSTVNPSRGFKAGAGTRLGLRDADSSSALLTDYSQLDFEVAAPVAGSVVGWAGLAFRAVYSAASLLEPELNRMGGAGGLRGYRDGQFRARSLGWLSLEPRYLAGGLSRLYPFVDIGGYGADGAIRLAAAWGVGARVGTGSGLLGLDYGVAFGESPLSGKVHLSLKIAF